MIREPLILLLSDLYEVALSALLWGARAVGVGVGLGLGFKLVPVVWGWL